MQFYDNGFRTQHSAAAAAVATSATLLTFYGPTGKVGRVNNASFRTSTTLAGATDSIITIASVTPAAQVGQVALVAGTTFNSIPEGPGNVAGTLSAGSDIAANSGVTVASDGGLTSGAADILVLASWW